VSQAEAGMHTEPAYHMFSRADCCRWMEKSMVCRNMYIATPRLCLLQPDSVSVLCVCVF